MTQFQPPSDVTPPPAGGYNSVGGVHSPPRWSAAAIAGFVLSLLGCTGVAAPFGFVFGIVGIVTTRRARLRGFGLAVAAVPVSLATGACSLLLLITVLMASSTTKLMAKLPEVFDADAVHVAASASIIREFFTDEFNQAVGSLEIETWIGQIAEKHGKLVEVSGFLRGQRATSDGRVPISFDAKFVNGRTSITVMYKRVGWKLRVDDIQVDGLSPRDLE